MVFGQILGEVGADDARRARRDPNPAPWCDFLPMFKKKSPGDVVGDEDGVKMKMPLAGVSCKFKDKRPSEYMALPEMVLPEASETVNERAMHEVEICTGPDGKGEMFVAEGVAGIE